jgi:RNA polymerase sigma-70 factor, ECF subfamily
MDQKTAPVSPSVEVDESEARPAAAPHSDATLPLIFQQHAPFLWRTLMNLGVPSHEAQDLCQEVMLIVHRRLATFDGRSLRGWLYGICVRVASDYRRSARVRREIPHGTLPDSGSDGDATDVMAQRQSVRRLLGALEKLGEEQRTALVLYEVEELTLAEISEALGVPLQTVYSRIKVARQSLRAELEASGTGGAREAG